MKTAVLLSLALIALGVWRGILGAGRIFRNMIGNPWST